MSLDDTCGGSRQGTQCTVLLPDLLLCKEMTTCDGQLVTSMR